MRIPWRHSRPSRCRTAPASVDRACFWQISGLPAFVFGAKGRQRKLNPAMKQALSVQTKQPNAEALYHPWRVNSESIRFFNPHGNDCWQSVEPTLSR